MKKDKKLYQIKIMRNNEMDFGSVGFSAGLLDSPFGYDMMLSEVGISQCQMSSTSSSW